MLIPRRTKIERAGMAISIISLLAAVIGMVAVAPDSVVETPVKPAVVFNQIPNARYRACVKRVTAEQAKSPQGVGRPDSTSRFDNLPPESVCEPVLDEYGAIGPRTLSLAEYARVYSYNVTSSIAVEGWAGHNVTELLLYWGVRFLIVGLFLMYLFETTIGRLLRFIWRGSLGA